MRTWGVIALMAAVAAGCSKPMEDAPAAAEKPRSSAGQAVDYFTGKTAVDAGQKAKADVQRISRQKNRELEEALGE